MSTAEQVIADIDAAYDAEPESDARGYIGASGVGNKCDAALAFSLRGFPDTKNPARLKRIFRDGHRIENEVIRDLRKAGYFVLDRDPLTGRQWRYELAGGHIVCHTDGQIALDKKDPDSLDLLEIKSMNDALFNKFKKDGVRVSHPKYWDQMQMMMGMSGHKRCLFIAYNKDKSFYWAEVVNADPFEWGYICTRLETVWRGDAAKISDDPTGWLCTGCFKHDVCWGSVIPNADCKTCENSFPTSDGKWWCRLKKVEANESCGDWAPYKPKEKTK